MTSLSSTITRQRPDYVSLFVPGQKQAIVRDQAIIRAMDILIALAAIVFFLPLIVVLSVTLAMQGGPVFFAHQRLGQNGGRFFCLKFRSMVVNAEERLAKLLSEDPEARREWCENHKLRNDPRITAFGRFLRRSSLDELPQLINVLKGEMSIVGPRPIVEAEIVKYGHHIKSYYAVKPGLTGLWQVSGRSDVQYRTRVAMDCVYARTVKPSLYLWLVLATIPAVLARRGSY